MLAVAYLLSSVSLLRTFSPRGCRDVVRARADRAALLVSGTSWTPDEDFGLLLDALVGAAALGRNLCSIFLGRERFADNS
jgi:hypothetical protein